MNWRSEVLGKMRVLRVQRRSGRDRGHTSLQSTSLEVQQTPAPSVCLSLLQSLGFRVEDSGLVSNFVFSSWVA